MSDQANAGSVAEQPAGNLAQPAGDADNGSAGMPSKAFQERTKGWLKLLWMLPY